MQPQYKPFQYPPDYAAARYHKEASMPGRIKRDVNPCPCCGLKPKVAFKSWWTRSIDDDFKNYGGSVVTYFWLLKYYFLVSLLVFFMYSTYLMYCIEQYCQNQTKCSNWYFVSIISNSDLWTLIKNSGDQDVLIRLFTLRGITFIFLLLANAFALYIVARFKRRYPPKPTIATYSLLFRNVKISPQQLALKLRQEFPRIEIKELFMVNGLEPYNTLTNNRMKAYYDCLNCDKQKQFKDLMKRLVKLDKDCDLALPQFNVHGDRAILLLNSIETKKEILDRYNLNLRQEAITLVFDNEANRLFCQQCPSPEEIIWNNFGTVSHQKLKTKVLSVFYFVVLLGISYLILAGCMHITYHHFFPAPWNTILINFILFFVVVLALTFRQLMNKLSEMRHPNTQTARTMFIVLTTVSFHFIYFIIIPTFYFYIAGEDQKSDTLAMVTNQTFNFVLFQILIMAFDVIHCCWNKRLKKVEDEEKPIGCQKILHQMIQYPRFPIEFKLIILFKFWSYTILFAFQVPIAMFMILCGLCFLLVKDKHVLYTHYRMEIIHNDVQFTFLRVYANFFSVYMLLIFIFTQHTQFEVFVGIPLTLVVMLFQTFAIKNPNTFEQHEKRIQKVADNEHDQIDDSVFLPLSFDELEIRAPRYKEIYNKFVEEIQDPRITQKIKELLATNGLRSLDTEACLQAEEGKKNEQKRLQ